MSNKISSSVAYNFEASLGYMWPYLKEKNVKKFWNMQKPYLLILILAATKYILIYMLVSIKIFNKYNYWLGSEKK